MMRGTLSGASALGGSISASGGLGGALSADTGRRSVQAFATVADMQAASNLLSGMVAHTNGFHASGDGGAAYYAISSDGTANGMDVLAFRDGLYASLVVTEPYVTPEQFGAWGDGETDDVAALQHATDTGLPVLLTKTYAIKSAVLDIKSSMVGSNGAAIVMLAGNTDEHRIRYRHVDGIVTSGITFDTSACQRGIGVIASSNLTFDNCKFDAGTFGTSDDVWTVRTLDLYTDWQSIKITNCEFNMVAPNAAGGLWIRNYYGESGASSGCIIENCKFTHCSLDECVAIWSSKGVQDVAIRGCEFNINWSSPIMMQTSGDNTTIEDCTFNITQGYASNRNPNNVSSLLTTSRMFSSQSHGGRIPTTVIRNCVIDYTPSESDPYKNLRFHSQSDIPDADRAALRNAFVVQDSTINYGMQLLSLTMQRCTVKNVSFMLQANIDSSTIYYQQLTGGQMSQGAICVRDSRLDLASNPLFFVQDLTGVPVEIDGCTFLNVGQRIYFSNTANNVRIIGNEVHSGSYNIAYSGNEGGYMLCCGNVLYSTATTAASKSGSNSVISNNMIIAPTT